MRDRLDSSMKLWLSLSSVTGIQTGPGIRSPGTENKRQDKKFHRNLKPIMRRSFDLGFRRSLGWSLCAFGLAYIILVVSRSWNIQWNRGRSHRHQNEDEYSVVIEGRIGAELGGKVVFGNRGDLIFKPRKQWHTFWNAGDEPARILEIISPAGFERYFEELASWERPLIPEKVFALAARYDVELDFDSIPHLIKEYGVRF
jgi:mannose-6-phosphate isomerase-like protein (cupin superfamily)